MKRVLVIIFPIIFLTSCCKQVNCDNDYGLSAAIFKGFTVPELDTIILEKFNVGNTTTPLSVTKLSPPDIEVDSQIFSDSGEIFVTAEYKRSLFNLVSGFDYKIVIPSIDTTIRILDIKQPPVTQQICNTIDAPHDFKCTNPITSYRQDTSLITGSSGLFEIRIIRSQ